MHTPFSWLERIVVLKPDDASIDLNFGAFFPALFAFSIKATHSLQSCFHGLAVVVSSGDTNMVTLVEVAPLMTLEATWKAQYDPS